MKKVFLTGEMPMERIPLIPSSTFDPSLSPLPFALSPMGAREGYGW